MSFALAPIFGDDLILQAGKPIRIYGRGNGHIVASLNGSEGDVFAEGEWVITLPAMPYGGPYTLTVTSEGQTVVCENVMLGDVLLLAGQSNMQFSLGQSETDRPTYQDDADLRLFVPGRATADQPYAASSGWMPCTRAGALQWSAIGYFLGNALRATTGHAIGLVGAYQGASVIESWMPRAAFAGGEYDLPAECLHADHTNPEFPWNARSCLWEHIAPQIVPFSFARVIWYQGESDTTLAEAQIYDRELASMIAAWRAELRDAQLPFTVIVLADLDDRTGRDGWDQLKQAQRRVSSLTDAVCVIECEDLCEHDAIHPATKSRLAMRIARDGMGE